MAILTPPASPRFKAGSILRPVTNTLSHTSALDRTTQTLEFPGAHWVGDYALPPMRADEGGEAWAALLTELDGPAGRLYLGPPDQIVPRGTAKDTPGTPVVNGAGQTGKALDIDGAPLSETGYLAVGDYVAYDTPTGKRQMHKLTAQADTDGSGAVTLAIHPPIRESPADGAAILLAPATCIMRLVDDDQARWAVDAAGFYTIAFSAVESFNT
jgi:hypothetical protein